MENSQAIEAASELVKMLPAVAIEGGGGKFVSTSDGRYLATGDDDGVVRLFEMEHGKEVANIRGPRKMSRFGRIRVESLW
jgi:WD40 repeat protein